MSDSLLPPGEGLSGSYLPPPPPPLGPPPGPPAPARTGFDFVRCLSYVFEDPAWVRKILLGGVFYLLGFFLIGWVFLLGYGARLARNVIAGVQHPLPEWDDLGEYFAEGIKLFIVALLYALPFLVLAMAVAVPMGMLSSFSRDQDMANLAGGLAGCVWCLFAPIILIVSLWVPAALLRVIVTRDLGAGFQFGAIWSFLKANAGNYLLAVLVHLVAAFAAQFGVILFCIGVIFTAFWSFCVSIYAFAESWRLAPVK
jgi:hypothetical protein